MKFVDEAPIHVKAGDGGPGAVSFRREKFVPRGGPNGGNGGKGGSIWAEATENATTLLDYQYEPMHRAKNGEPGRGSDQYGHDGADIVLKVPVGTLVKDAETGEVLHDLSQNCQRALLAKGGRGGMGNMHFATATRQAPRFAQPGEPGEEKDLVLELKLLADVGLLGYPNAGKSTLISRLSKARPKIADYPFTTLTPHLGVVPYKDHKSFVMADIPGIIEGAHEGAGLGHQFLKHVERCRILIHMIDCSIEPMDDVTADDFRSPMHDLDVLNRELALYSEKLADIPQIVAATKIDLPESRERALAFAAAMQKTSGKKVFLISSATGEGVQELVDAAAQALFSPGSKK